MGKLAQEIAYGHKAGQIATGKQVKQEMGTNKTPKTPFKAGGMVKEKKTGKC